MDTQMTILLLTLSRYVVILSAYNIKILIRCLVVPSAQEGRNLKVPYTFQPWQYEPVDDKYIIKR